MVPESLHAAISTTAEAIRDEIITVARELVRTPSVNHPPTGDELACQQIIAAHLRQIGLAPELYDLDSVAGLREHPAYFGGRDYRNRPNVVARRAGSGGGRALVLSGHVDTVPLGTQPWSRDPFGGEIVDGRLYGLGAVDMKGGLAAALGAVAVLQRLDLPLRGDLIFESVVDEEFGGVNGTLAGRVRGDNGSAMVIPEPSALAVYNGVRGGRVAHITLAGPEGILFEGGEPGHAIRQLTHFLRWVEIFRARRRAKCPGWEPGPFDPVPVWVTKVSGGGWGWNVPITVPAVVQVELYWQLMPGEEQAAVEGEFFAWLDEMAAADPVNFSGRPAAHFPIRFMPAAEIPAAHPFVQQVVACAEAVTGERPPVMPLPAPSDMYVVQRDFATPAVHYGPRGAGAHAADEYVLIDDLVTVTRTLALLAATWCA